MRNWNNLFPSNKVFKKEKSHHNKIKKNNHNKECPFKKTLTTITQNNNKAYQIVKVEF